ncbi:hypothetical protein FE257_007110 [Aspergillus nanangensis]|uniref:AB hydrolase-1 domain-containing protein n=1 Tax=Aspergillus nanangensis TaxID=2582783 RepID=A0AAD4GUC6_ASPNN|nr:hypothetical protein FE257_007110 [Aspergillus nanangensis]
MSPISFTVVIAHGSCHTPAPYQPLIDALQKQGIEAYCPQRPTCDLSRLNVGDIHQPDFNRPPPVGGYPTAADDAAELGEVLDRLIGEGKSVLLVAHSSGGWVAAEAATAARQAPKRIATGQSGGIIGIFFVGAFLIPAGESVSGFFQPPDGSFVVPPFMQFYEHGGNGLGTMKDPAHFLFPDVDSAMAQKWADTLTAAPIMDSPLTHDPYPDLPCAYVVLDEDRTLPKEYQEGMIAAQRAKDSIDFIVYHAPSGHSPHISWTGGLVGKIEEFVGQIQEIGMASDGT